MRLLPHPAVEVCPDREEREQHDAHEYFHRTVKVDFTSILDATSRATTHHETLSNAASVTAPASHSIKNQSIVIFIQNKKKAPNKAMDSTPGAARPT